MTNEKTTIYLNPAVKKTAKYYALAQNRSMSEIINDRLIEYFEDIQDMAELKKREENSEFVSLPDALKELGIDEKELHSRT